MSEKPVCPTAAIVVAAGSSSRMGGKVRKPYLELQGKPILSWTLAALSKVAGLKQIVIVTRPEDRPIAQDAATRASLPAEVKLDFADGGARRQDSVWNGLCVLASGTEVVLIHDAARPFPPLVAMNAACAEAFQNGAAILAVRVKDTVKRESATGSAGLEQEAARIETTVPRAGLWLAQTPQVFRRGLIERLFGRLAGEAPGREVTDDASICEIFEQPVALIDSSETNFKVTRPEDIAIADALMRAGVVGGSR